MPTSQWMIHSSHKKQQQLNNKLYYNSTMKIFRSAFILLPLLVASNGAMLRKKGPPREQGNIRHRQLDEALPSEVPTASPGDTELPTVSTGDTELPTVFPSPQ
jgi:hypothetical protein